MRFSYKSSLLVLISLHRNTTKTPNVFPPIASFSKKRTQKTMMNFIYPVPKRDKSAVDKYFGVKVPDPYRWLEDPDSPETKEFVAAQNELSIPYLDGCKYRKEILKRLTDSWNFPRYECPFKEGDHYYYFKNSGLQNQSVLYQQDSLEGEPRPFLDPNKLSSEGLISISHIEFSEDGRWLAYGLSEGGSDWCKLKVKRVSNGEDLPETLLKVKFSNLAWTHDNKGFFYSAFPDADISAGGSETTPLSNHTLYYHRIGTEQAEDVLCAQFPDHNWSVYCSISNCGNYAIVTTMEACKNNMLFYCDLRTLPDGIKGTLPLTCVIDTFEADYDYVDNDGTTFLIQTDKNAPRFRLISVNLEDPAEANWKEVIPEHPKNVIHWAMCVDGDKLMVCYLEDVKHTLYVHSARSGELLHKFSLRMGCITGYSGKKKLSEVFFRFVSFLTPGIIYHCDFKKGFEAKEFRRTLVEGLDESLYEMRQVFYPSRDGTPIPMFILHQKDIKMDGSSPAFLYGYGGFNACILPYFSISRLNFLRHFRGVLAVANLRGGGEYGETWHSAGKLLNKQNVFDDFHAAAEYLIANKYTSAKKLTINGASNGGLLVGACVNQRPELYGCAIAQVGVMDMLKFHKFTVGDKWKSDYGSSDEEEHFHSLLKYSPLHNVRVPSEEGVQYPAVLLLTGDHDDRVVPLHSLKLIAQMQHTLRDSKKQVNPLLIRVDVQSGHGGGKPTSKVIEEFADMFCFMANTMGLEYFE